MHQKSILILCLILCGVLALAAGCTTPGTEANVTPTVTASSVRVSPEQLILTPADLPSGFSIAYIGKMAPGDPNCNASEFCYLEGVLISARSGETNMSTAIDQAVVLYSKPATRERLDSVLADQLPGVAGENLTTLADPGIGDVSAAYQVTIMSGDVPVDGYLVIFGIRDYYEIILVAGPDATENLAEEMARAAASKLS
jgi:hypothetical protein